MPVGQESYGTVPPYFFTLMKKNLFFFAALLCSFNVANAQVNFIATLQHGNTTTQYYGGGAFVSAYNTAEDGDVITLSPGTFSSPGNFTKGITLRGAGIDAAQKTFISGETHFYSDDAAKTTTVEGIVFSSGTYIYNNKNDQSHGKINFIKDRMSIYVRQQNNPTETGPVVRIYNSICNHIEFASNSHPDFIFYNCFINNPNSSLSTTTTSAFVNCVIRHSSYYAQYAHYLNFHNCIFNNTYTYTQSLPNTATCFNCLSIKNSSLFSNLVSGSNNKTVGTTAEVFKTYTGDYQYGETFELTDEARINYLGTDGKQRGMQGGNYPYNSTVQYPIITKFESATETTKGGKLNIDIQVDGK